MKMDHFYAHALKLARLDKCVTQAQLAETAELDRSYISALERGIYQPSLETVLKIAIALNVDAADFVEVIDQQIEY